MTLCLGPAMCFSVLLQPGGSQGLHDMVWRRAAAAGCS